MILLAAAAACLAAAVYLVAVAPRRALRTAIGRAALYGRVAPVEERNERGLPPGVAALGRIALRLSPRASRESVQASLLAAGLGGRIAPEVFLAAKLGAAAVGAVAGLALAGAAGRGGAGVLVAVPLALAGFVAPDAVVKGKAARRRETILSSLPNALDLLAVSVEAGLGLDGAVARYAETGRGPLAEELGRVVTELRVGATRREVLRRFAARVPAPETAAFVRAIVHADQLGVSLTRTLRTQAAESRLRRQSRAEEVANKAPVKMLFPTVFFIFPAMFAIVLGPALLYLSHAF